ncbi:phage tail protein [Paenibacillus sp. NPDC057967]|uniref:phage tail protein n=1 Tax=Paenibacillus sp. NPDC057967 TaxID=3346293 RepID=UPI0036DAEEED
MAEPFVGELRLFPFNRTPRGWMPCEGQLMNIQTNQVLFSLIGATYGGDGRSNFALPDLRGRVPVHVGAGINYGLSAGEANHTLTVNEIPAHTHQALASSNPADVPDPQNQGWAGVSDRYGEATALTSMNAGAIGTSGGSQAHSNMQPYLTVRYCIALQGIYPPRQ